MNECVMYIFSFSAGEKKLYNIGILILDGSSKKERGGCYLPFYMFLVITK